MNTTININLAGQLFYMDENAYNTLKQYLEEIAAYFKNSDIKTELMSDIEARIAELFLEKLAHERQVITAEEVTYVIDIMGQPKDYQLSDDEDENHNKDKKEKTHERKFFRDPDDTVLGGVAAGIGHYFGVQVSWVRLIWLLLAIFSWGGFTILYFALWIFIAPAKTAAEKLAMKGEPVNISTLEKKFREGINDVKDSINNVDYKATTEKARSGVHSFFKALGSFMQTIIGALAKFTGIILIIVSYVVLFSLTITLFSVGLAELFGFTFSGISDFIEFQYWGFPVWLASIPILFLVGIPFAFLAILGQRLLSDSKKKNSSVMLILLGLWIVSIVATISIGLHFASITF